MINDSEITEEIVYYANCSAAREAGAAPLYEGDPGYSIKLDRDRDGIACS
ncbi:excalibur calcium-binding domain-containing protein [Paenibacillus sp. FSL H8-0548]